MTNTNQTEEAGKLFVGGLSWETTQENLHRYFSRFGEVVDCVVMKNSETGRSRGFGFVTFKDPSCVSVVLSSGPHELDGRTIDPKSCSPRGMQKPKKSGNYPKIFLGGLPSSCTETDLRNFFSKYGKVVEVVIMFDQENKKSRGFGFLSFESEDSIEQVCSEHYVNINGKQVECKRAEPRDTSRNFKNQQQQPNQQPANQWGGPGMGMGGPGGWGPGPMGPGGPSGPGMGPGPGVPAGPMGPSVANGMMPGGYQGGGWGGPQQQGPYGPQGGYGGYQGWGAPSAGFGPYPGPGPQYGQQGYGYGTPGAPGFGGYGGFGAPMGGAPAPGGPPGVQSGGPEMYNQAGPVGPAGNAPGQGNQPPGTAAGAPAGPKTDFGYNNPYGSMGNYPQESSSFGPSRGGYGGGPGGGFGAQGSGPHGMGGSGAGAGVAGGGGPQGGGSGFGRGSGQSQGYHPYRRV